MLKVTALEMKITKLNMNIKEERSEFIEKVAELTDGYMCERKKHLERESPLNFRGHRKSTP